MSVISKISDFVFVIRMVKLLTTPWEKQEAYRLGLIDKQGTLIIPYDEMSDVQKSAYGYFTRFVLNIKRLISKASKSTLADIYAAYVLLKEEAEKENEAVDGEVWSLFEEAMLALVESEELDFLAEDAPTNATGGAVSTNTPTGGPVVRRSYKALPEFRGCKIFEVESDHYHKLRNGKIPGDRWDNYFEPGTEPGDTIKAYSRSNPGKPVIIRCNKTQSMQFLKPFV